MKMLAGNQFSVCSRVQHEKIGSDSNRSLQQFKSIREAGLRPSISMILAALKVCSSSRDLDSGKAIHEHIFESGSESNLYVANTLVAMYARCGDMVSSRQVFERIQHRSVVSWTNLMLGYVDVGDGEMALELFLQMQDQGLVPNRVAFIAALKACARLCAKEQGKVQANKKIVKVKTLELVRAIRSQLSQSGYEQDEFVANTLVDVYGKCGSMDEAYNVFHRMKQHDVASWNSIILGYAETGDGDLALQLFRVMQRDGVVPNARTYVAALKATCASVAAKEESLEVDGKSLKHDCLEKGRAIHYELARRGHESDVFVASTLVDLYSRCGSMSDARSVFERMKKRSLWCWNALILGYAQSGEGAVALDLFSRLQDQGFTPDARTYVAALKACAACACLEKGSVIHSQAAVHGFEDNVFVVSSLVEMYATCGSMVDAEKIFSKIQQRGAGCWAWMVIGYADNNQGELALEFFKRMRDEGVTPDSQCFVAALKACGSLESSDHRLETLIEIHSQIRDSGQATTFVANTLLDVYCKCGRIVLAREVFQGIKNHTVISWTTVILGYAESGDAKEALRLFARMLEAGCHPNSVTFMAALKACSSLAALELGREIHIEAHYYFGAAEIDPVLATTLIDFYGRCGCMVEAQRVFESISNSKLDLVAWNSLIAGYSRQGDIENVIILFEKLRSERSIKPNGITFLSLLSACGHAGLVSRGKLCFGAMTREHGIAPSMEHYLCMVDLLSRANQLEEAVAMIESMEFPADARIWKAVLAGCKKWRNVVLGKLVFEAIVKLDDADAATYVMIADICKL